MRNPSGVGSEEPPEFIRGSGQPYFLCEGPCGLGIFDASQNMGVDFGMVFLPQGVKGFGIALLCAVDEYAYAEVCG